MLKELSLSNKLRAMIAVPVIGLVLFAGMDLKRRVAVSSEMADLEQLTDLAMKAHATAAAINDERSLTAGAVTDDDAGRGELELQFDQTDRAVADLRTTVTELSAAVAGTDLMAELSAIRESLDQLPRHRQQVVTGDLSTAAAVSFYNELNQLLLPVLTGVTRRTTNVDVKTSLMALDLLAHLKESADLERAALNVAFSSGQISLGLQRAVVEMVSRQSTLADLFRNNAPADAVALFDARLTDEALEEFALVRGEAMEAWEEDQLTTNPRQWWVLSTARIDALSEVEELLGTSTLTTVTALRGRARRAAWLGTVIVLLMVGGAVGLSALVGRSVNVSLDRASGTIGEMAGQISSSVQQLTASTGETASAISQTSTTVDELRQTSETAATKAEATSAAAEQSRGASAEAQDVADQGIKVMQAIREQVEGIAERIVELSEKNAQISDIVENVDAIAQQSNLLAVNASIEAAKAGEHGRGFAVVASEVKTLAERSKEATDQIRAILTEIQRSSNAAVMATEQGVKRVDEGSSVIDRLGAGMETLAVTIQDSSDAAKQISLISNQQLAGIEQITEALRSVEQAANDNAVGAHQLSGAAERLREVSRRISNIVQGRQHGDGLRR
jgi:methyl-accepting chemotaxis protein